MVVAEVVDESDAVKRKELDVSTQLHRQRT